MRIIDVYIYIDIVYIYIYINYGLKISLTTIFHSYLIFGLSPTLDLLGGGGFLTRNNSRISGEWSNAHKVLWGRYNQKVLRCAYVVAIESQQ